MYPGITEGHCANSDHFLPRFPSIADEPLVKFRHCIGHFPGHQPTLSYKTGYACLRLRAGSLLSQKHQAYGLIIDLS